MTPCCTNHRHDVIQQIPIPALIVHITPTSPIHVLTDPGCLQINLVDRNMANNIVAQGATRENVTEGIVPGKDKHEVVVE